VAALAYLVIGLVTATLDHDEFGTVPIPGQETVELEAGTVGVYYQERNAGLSENESVDAPAFQLSISRRGDAPVELEDEGGGSSYELGSLAGTQIGRLEVPDDGPYTVVTGGNPGRESPEVSFGKDVPLGTLLGRSALILLGGMALGGLLWWVGNARRKKEPLQPASASASLSARVSAPAPPPAPASAPGVPTPEPPPHSGFAMPPPRTPVVDPAERLRELEARKTAGQIGDAEYTAAREAILREL
jgi:hypothetical protein